MDTFTHALSGALLGRATASPEGPLTVRRRVAAGFLVAAFPDSDALLALFVDPLSFINLHRGVTHSILLMPLWALLLAWVLALLFRDRAEARLGWRPWYGIALGALAIHIAGDVITSYGTRIFAPLSDYKAAWPTTFIIDPWFTGILLAGLLASLLWRASLRPARIALAVLVGYVGMQAYLMQQAQAVGERYAAEQGLAGADVHVLPQPLSPFNWKVLVERDETYHVALINLRRQSPPLPPAEGAGLLSRFSAAYLPPAHARWERIEKFGDGESRELARQAWDQATFAAFRRFAEYPALWGLQEQAGGTCVWFVDLRFTSLLPDGTTRTPFRYGLCRDGRSAPWRVYEMDRGEPKAIP